MAQRTVAIGYWSGFVYRYSDFYIWRAYVVCEAVRVCCVNYTICSKMRSIFEVKKPNPAQLAAAVMLVSLVTVKSSR